MIERYFGAKRFFDIPEVLLYVAISKPLISLSISGQDKTSDLVTASEIVSDVKSDLLLVSVLLMRSCVKTSQVLHISKRSS